MVVDPLVGLLDRGLRASLRVFDFCKQRLESLEEGVDETKVTRAELVRLRRAGLVMNQAISRLADRSIIELHILRQTLRGVVTDRDANRARVYERP